MVSVIIPTYNRENTIKESIDSVLNQTYKDIELIVVDDGSTDGTAGVVGSIKDGRLKYIQQENGGACVARNKGVSMARGEYIAFQDSDDTWSLDKLEKQVSVLENHTEADIVCCKTKCTRSNGSHFTSLKGKTEGFVKPYGVSTQTLLVRREVFADAKFDPLVTRYQDLDFLLVASEKHKIYLVPELLVVRNHQDNSISNHPERIYDMAKYFRVKHAKIMNDRHAFLPYFFASVLIEESPKRFAGKKKNYKLALELNKSPKIIIKLILNVLHIR